MSTSNLIFYYLCYSLIMSIKGDKARKQGVQSHMKLYAKVAKYADEVIKFQVDTMRDKKAPHSVRQSAANKLIDKILPDLKAVELKGDEENPLTVYTKLSDDQLDTVINAKIEKNRASEIVAGKREQKS